MKLDTLRNVSTLVFACAAVVAFDATAKDLEPCSVTSITSGANIVASAAKPEGNGSVTTASADKPEGNGNVVTARIEGKTPCEVRLNVLPSKR